MLLNSLLARLYPFNCPFFTSECAYFKVWIQKKGYFYNVTVGLQVHKVTTEVAKNLFLLVNWYRNPSFKWIKSSLGFILLLNNIIRIDVRAANADLEVQMRAKRITGIAG